MWTYLVTTQIIVSKIFYCLRILLLYPVVKSALLATIQKECTVHKQYATLYNCLINVITWFLLIIDFYNSPLRTDFMTTSEKYKKSVLSNKKIWEHFNVWLFNLNTQYFLEILVLKMNRNRIRMILVTAFYFEWLFIE